MFLIGGLFFLALLALGILSTIFWIVELIECATKESSEGNDKIIWILIIFFGHFLGALLYYFVRRPQRIATLGR